MKLITTPTACTPVAPMEKILSLLESAGEFDVTIVLQTGEKVTGLIESTADGVVSISRLIDNTQPGRYAENTRHYSIGAVIGAYYAEGS